MLDSFLLLIQKPKKRLFMILNLLRSGYQTVRSALAKSRSMLGSKLKSIFKASIDGETLDRLEQLLYEADLGVDMAANLTAKVGNLYKKDPSLTGEDLIAFIRDEIHSILSANNSEIRFAAAGPTVIFVVGVNGNGKTTTIAKLAHYYKKQGLSVLLSAADTFRAAAVEQLEIWATHAAVDIVRGCSGADPAAVAYDAVSAALSRKVDLVLIDTAGRLQTKTNLLQELEKMRRSCKKLLPQAPHETLLVIDAAIGQNAIDQAITFNRYTPITGLVLTKLDGTAKGGIAVAIQQQLGIPIKFIGTGETLEDLSPFNATEYTDALFE